MANPRLERIDLDPDPIRLFGRWYAEARSEGVAEPEAMCLSTCPSAGGAPSSRIVYLRGHGPEGFVFFTNYGSRKSRELESNPQAALLFYWREQGRQVRINGRAERTSEEESRRYFDSRDRLSRLGAWASRQSEPVEERGVLEARLEEFESRYPDEAVPLPSWWGGWRVIPDVIEFWQRREHRLHDRFRYDRQADGAWLIGRLYP